MILSCFGWKFQSSRKTNSLQDFQISFRRNCQLSRVVLPFLRKARGRSFQRRNFRPRLLPNFADSLSSLMKLELARRESREHLANYNGCFFGTRDEAEVSSVQRISSISFPIREKRGSTWMYLFQNDRIFYLPCGYLTRHVFHATFDILWDNVLIW